MGRSGYTSLSLDEKRYAKLRRGFEIHVSTDKTFTAWATDTLDTAIEKQGKLKKSFPGLRYIGNKTGGCILEDDRGLIEITITESAGKSALTCSRDRNICNHVLFAVLHPDFVF